MLAPIYSLCYIDYGKALKHFRLYSFVLSSRFQYLKFFERNNNETLFPYSFVFLSFYKPKILHLLQLFS